MNHFFRHPSLVLFFSLLFVACSSGVNITTTRLSGVVLDRSVVVEVGRIHGNDDGEFRSELTKALASMSLAGTGDQARLQTRLTVDGTYIATMDRSSSTETVDGKEVERIEETFSVQFDYRIIERATGTEVTYGTLRENSRDVHEREEQGLLASILSAIVSVIVTGDPYANLREHIVARFIHEISPRERQIEVTLFEDSDMPELEQGIRMAEAGRWKDALGVFLDAIDRHRGHVQVHKAYFNAGVAYEYTHQYSLAREHMERALEMSPEAEYAAELERCLRYEQEWKWREDYLEKLRMMKSSEE